MNTFFREVNEDNVLIRNILGEFEDSLKYVSSPTTQLPMHTIHRSLYTLPPHCTTPWRIGYTDQIIYFFLAHISDH